MNMFWELLKESVIIQSLVTLILVVVVSYMYVTGIPVPDTLVNLLMVIVGYWFGSKTQQVISRAR